MDDRRWGRGVLCTEALVEDDAVVKGDVVETVLARLAAGETVSAVEAAFDLDRKTVRAWRARGAYRPRAPRERATLVAPHAAWLTGRAPEVDFNSEVLARELRTHFGYTGTVQTVLRFIRPLRLAAQRPSATVRFDTPPGQQAQMDLRISAHPDHPVGRGRDHPRGTSLQDPIPGGGMPAEWIPMRQLSTPI